MDTIYNHLPSVWHPWGNGSGCGGERAVEQGVADCMRIAPKILYITVVYSVFYTAILYAVEINQMNDCAQHQMKCQILKENVAANQTRTALPFYINVNKLNMTFHAYFAGAGNEK